MNTAQSEQMLLTIEQLKRGEVLREALKTIIQDERLREAFVDLLWEQRREIGLEDWEVAGQLFNGIANCACLQERNQARHFEKLFAYLAGHIPKFEQALIALAELDKDGLSLKGEHAFKRAYPVMRGVAWNLCISFAKTVLARLNDARDILC